MLKKVNYNISKNIFYNHFVAFGNIYSGILIGLSAPGFGTHWLGIISFIPLSLNLERQHAKNITPFWKRVLLIFTTCWITGIISTSIACYWITNSIHIFGHLPWPAAIFITGVGYGLEVGFQLFVYFGIPLLFIKKLNNWDLPVRFLYILALEPWYPKLIQWNFGGLTFSEFPLIEQLADLIGSSGLIIFNLGVTFLTVGWLRMLIRRESFQKNLLKATIAYFLLCFFGLIYGTWRLYSLEENTPDLLVQNSKLDILLVQPNFSLKDLASNPELSYSERKYNLENLIIDSKNGLRKLIKNNDSTRLVVWPESVFPEPFFKNKQSRQKVIDFAKKNKVYILFTTIDWENTSNGEKFFGVSVLLDKKGDLIGRYNKIFLIPFGEMIPFSSWFPKIASWLRRNISNMSEFHPGNEFKVFNISGGSKFSAPICFDIFAPVVIRKMVQNGSNLIINLSNLAWFGKTNASDSMVAFLRWRAIENRVPVVFASNNGQSLFIGANGENLTKQLNLFEEGTIYSTLKLRSRFSFYREFAEWLWGIYILMFLVYCYLAYRIGKIF